MNAESAYMLAPRSQISTLSLLTTPNTVAQRGDHMMSYTASLMEVKLSTGVK